MSFSIKGFSLFVGFVALLSTLASAATISVDIDKEYQRISGFGAASAWAGSITDKNAAFLWDSTSGAGLTLHRIRIAPDGTTSETSIAKKASEYGVKVWAAPWTSKYTVNYDGDKKHLDFNHAQDWANTILKFTQDMRKAGVNLYAVSSQNEPDGTGDNHYEPDELARWVGDYLGPTLDTTGIKIIGTEAINWYGFPNYKKAFFNNPAALKYTDIFGTHEYGGDPAAYPEIHEAGKEFWETEVYDLGSNKEDVGMGSALRVAGVIHDALTISNMNAWHFWWIYSCSEASCGNGALWPQGQGNPDNVEPTKRLWVMGNFSRFARPGARRIDATKDPEANVKVTAYRDSLKTKIAVVILNSKNEEFNVDFDFGSTKIASFKPYVTDDNSNLKEGSEVDVDDTKCKYSVPARSATTVEFILWQEPKVEPPSDSAKSDTSVVIATPTDSTTAIAFGKLSVPQSHQSTYKVFSPLGAFVGEFQAGHVGELRNAMTSAGLGRGVYMVKCGNAKTQYVVLK